jgi:hypothetical protein
MAVWSGGGVLSAGVANRPPFYQAGSQPRAALLPATSPSRQQHKHWVVLGSDMEGYAGFTSRRATGPSPHPSVAAPRRTPRSHLMARSHNPRKQACTQQGTCVAVERKWTCNWQRKIDMACTAQRSIMEITEMDKQLITTVMTLPGCHRGRQWFRAL